MARAGRFTARRGQSGVPNTQDAARIPSAETASATRAIAMLTRNELLTFLAIAATALIIVLV